MPQQNNKNAVASQEFVTIKEVRDGVIILKGGGMRAVLMASSVNFALKSEDERTGFIFQFQNFLNSLDFTTQIYIQSRDLDIRPYTRTLEEAYAKTTDDLMRIQIKEYTVFIQRFVENANIMTKQFFVVVPYNPVVLSLKKGFLSQITKKGTKQSTQNTFEENLTQLDQRIAIVQQGLIRSGIRSVQLNTEEIIELFYKIFNPSEKDMPESMLSNSGDIQM